jgi:hypothetical protein
MLGSDPHYFKRWILDLVTPPLLLDATIFSHHVAIDIFCEHIASPSSPLTETAEELEFKDR